MFARVSGRAHWIEVGKLIPSEAIGHDFAHCGWDVSIQGQIILLSCVGMKVDGIRRVGITYVFERRKGVWKPTQKLIPSEERGREEAHCGYNVSLEGKLAMVSCISMEGGRIDKITYVFERFANGSWNELGRITPTKWPYDQVGQ